ncbi:hypothetical protein [Scandinavium lactucae]|uniref:Uncharacterized protein n=1 Tax=Scandinavium lactucae TaxID=3095028 RepID=A0ABU4QM66_9ENTR|nr:MULTISPECIES: hypothetical protein [unclassified Scandinavium]MDX6039952.1 hypothetical protein [Scandinavium sp. V105_6]MDX6051860.1 hypothetical protein [Scandinavium sp. V105_1]
MFGITTRVSAFFGNSNANLDMSRFYSAKNELKKADKYCRRAESLIAKDLKKARNSSTKYDLAKVHKLYKLSEHAAYSRKYLDNRLKTITPSGMDNNKAKVKQKSSSMPGNQNQVTAELTKIQVKAMEDYLKSSEHVNHLKGNLIKLCEKIGDTESLEDGQVRRVVTCLQGLVHLDSDPATSPSVDSYTALLAEKVDGVTFKDLGNIKYFTQDQTQAIIDYLPRIKKHVESSS